MSSGSADAAGRGERPVVVVTRRLPAGVEATLAERYDVRLNSLDVPLHARAMLDAAREADALLCTVTDSLGPELFTTPDRRMRVVANYGVGVNHIALDAASAAGVAVSNTPDVLTDDTADLAIALMLAVARRMGEGERLVRAGAWTGWAPTQMLGARVSGGTLGVVGYGRIGQAVARRAHHGFGMRVLYHQRRRASDQDEARASASYRPSLDAMLEECDVLSLHCPSTPETRGLIGADRLRRMRRTAFLVNTARGEVVDEHALGTALREGWIAGAGLDVYAREPAVPPSLLDLENVVLLPHLGSATRETRTAMGLRAIANLDAFFAGQPMPDRVA